jgi:hypothetical protein
MSTQEDWHDEEQRPRGMSTTTKVLLTLAAVGGVFLLLCCGGVFYGVQQFQKFAKDAVKTNPADVRQATAEIIHIDLPPEFEPKQSMDMIFMKMVIWQHRKDRSATVMISQIGTQFATGDTEQQRQQMLDAMRQQGQQQGPTVSGKTTIETREIDIDGETIPFQFVTGERGPDGKTHRQVSGVIPTSRGMVMVMIAVPDDVLDDGQIESILNSIHAPDGDAPYEEAKSEEPAAEKPAAENTPAEQPATENSLPGNQPAEKPPE